MAGAQTAIGELNDGVGAPAIRQRGLYFEHVRRQKIGQQTLEARLSELSAQVRQFQHIVQVVNGVAQRSNLSQDRKSTRLNSSHVEISYAVFCLKKKKKLYTI